MGLKDREARELEAFETLVSKSEYADDALVVPSRDIERYRNPYLRKRFPIDLLFKTLGDVEGLRILDIGCGDGFWSTVLGILGGKVTSIDLSGSHLAIGNRRAQVNNVSTRVAYLQASGHDLPFATGVFDVVFGNAIVHHVDVQKCGSEVRRVLRIGGRAVFREPVALSQNLRKLRKTRLVMAVVKDRGVSPDEEPLSESQILLLGRGFSEARIYPAQMISRLERVLPGHKTYELLNALDNKLFEGVPFLKRFAREAIIELIR